jgi:transposase
MAAAVCFRPDGSDAALVFGMRRHPRLGSAHSHRSGAMKRFIGQQRPWLLVVEPLPPYAYDLNPVEQEL